MELIYVWIKEYKCIRRQGFCLSPEFTVKEWDGGGKKEAGKLMITYNKRDNLFQEGPIANLTVLVGENGSGKTTFLEYVHDINCFPEEILDRNKPDQGKNVIVVRDGEWLIIYTNLTSEEMEIECHVEPFRYRIIDRNDREKTAKDSILSFDYFTRVTRLHITNNYYGLMNGSWSRERLDSLVFSPGALSAVTDEFFQFVCPDEDGEKGDELFWQYSSLLKDRKRTGGFQQLCDVLFYWRLIERKALKEYGGFVQTDLIFRVSSVYQELNDIESHLKTEEDQRHFRRIKECFDRLCGIYDKDRGKESPVYILKMNAIAEYLLYQTAVMDELPSDSIEELFEKLENRLGNGTGSYQKDECRRYFLEAWDEIRDFEDLTYGLELCASRMWRAGGEDKKGLKASFDRNAEIPEESQYARICRFLAGKISDNESIRRGQKKFGSFILRYMIIDNLLFSSGERAFQNLMSWMSFGAELSKAAVRELYVPKREILLCIDEADLYCHPSWQRDFIDNLLTLIKTAYAGYTVQIIMTTHSPLCLSDVPREHIIYLKNDHGKTTVDQEEHRQTFGCNLYELLNDAFYLDNQTMGKFAKRTINELIGEINAPQGFLREKMPELRRRIERIGDSFIRRKLERQMEWQWQKQLEQRGAGAASDEQRLKILEEEKERIERQIKTLKGKNE